MGPPPPFGPELARALDIARPHIPTYRTLENIAEVRAAVRDSDIEDLTLGGTYDVVDLVIPGPVGAPGVSLVVCRPVRAEEPRPALYYMHGGGMISGDARKGLADMVRLASTVGAAVVSVEYRLAPETPHPGPVEDCFSGLTWVYAHGSELGIDPHRLIVGGKSAGGGLAAATTLLARDRGGPEVIGQLLLCPMLDDRNDSLSAVQMEGQGVWDRADNLTGWTALLGSSRGRDDVSPYAAPARAVDLSGLPPTFIEVGSAETFRDENVRFASRIWQAGGPCELHVWPGGFHGFDSVAPEATLSKDAVVARRQWLKRVVSAA